MARSFVDTDLLEPDERPDPVTSTAGADAPESLARQKEQIQEQVADAAEEIERLQMRQKELEQARQALRELHRKQHEYEEGKKSIIEKLSRSSLHLQKEEDRLTRKLELVSATRRDFAGMLRELREIREDQWSESGFEEALDSALALLESMRGVYRKSSARLEAQGVDRIVQTRSHGDDPVGEQARMPSGWLVWFRAGIAFSLCLGAVGAILLALYLHLR
ncbi:MAG: hypothetical protein ACNA71_05910 [Kiritimatiellia bacterium]